MSMASPGSQNTDRRAGEPKNSEIEFTFWIQFVWLPKCERRPCLFFIYLFADSRMWPLVHLKLYGIVRNGRRIENEKKYLPRHQTLMSSVHEKLSRKLHLSYAIGSCSRMLCLFNRNGAISSKYPPTWFERISISIKSGNQYSRMAAQRTESRVCATLTNTIRVWRRFESMGELVYGTRHVAATSEYNRKSPTPIISRMSLMHSQLFGRTANTFTLFIYIDMRRRRRRRSSSTCIDAAIHLVTCLSVCRVFILYFCASIRINRLDIVHCWTVRVRASKHQIASTKAGK